MSAADEALMAITAWRENRSGGTAGMQSVINVIQNRATDRGTTPYVEAVRPMQFSSITAHGDPELGLWPSFDDPQWVLAQQLARTAAMGNLPDITGGATSYYALSIPAPYWVASMTKTVEIAGQIFFR
ncbi:MAG: cell wall hydrolase [Terriglobales bacterium]